MSFRDMPFSQRFAALGDQAEAVFEATYPEGWARYGLNRPPVNLARVPAFIKYTPDYLTGKGLVEVQGFGRDQTFKLKLDKAIALADWHDQFRVDLFVYDSHNEEYAWIRWPELQPELPLHALLAFPEGKQYYAIKKGELPVVGGWSAVDAT